MNDLPYISADVPGIGGHIKCEPEHFIVEEVALYEPCGSGEHVYVRLRRENWTTRDLQRALAALFGVRERDIGCAGQKDKRARVTQTFSFVLANVANDAIAQRIERELGVEVLDVARHANKLKRGHLLGNRFDIVVVDPFEGALALARATAAVLDRHGLPNAYAEQRLGAQGRNVQRGRAVLDALANAHDESARPVTRRASSTWTSRFQLSAYQSSLFNIWLTERIARGDFERLIEGDIAKKLDTGGLFDVVDLAVEEERFARREITYTGPIFGARMRWPNGQAGLIERALLASTGFDESDFARARLDGSRRAARIFPEELTIESDPAGVRLRFRLPKGSYATALLREIMKNGAPTYDAMCDDERA